MNKQAIFILAFALLSLNLSNYNNSEKSVQLKISDSQLFPVQKHPIIRDTLYTFEQHFIIVNLSTQTGYLYSRNEPVMKFGVSSGNIKLDKAVETNEGLFVIQCMMKKWYSSQFDSTLMLNWMGFNNGIGFHALQSHGYYRYLGIKPSSHGCVRISQEDANTLFSLIDVGTPVLVNNGEPAITIAFADSNSNYKHYSNSELRNVLKDRFDLLYNGKYLLNELPKICISKSNVTHQGLPVGNADYIPEKQFHLNANLNFSTSTNQDVLHPSVSYLIPHENDLSFVRLN